MPHFNCYSVNYKGFNTVMVFLFPLPLFSLLFHNILTVKRWFKVKKQRAVENFQFSKQESNPRRPSTLPSLLCWPSQYHQLLLT